MYLAKDGQHLLGAKADTAMATGMEPCGSVAEHLHLGGRADGGKDRLDVGLGIKDVNGARAALHLFGASAADQKAHHLQMLFFRLAALKGVTDLEQGKIHDSARLIAGGGQKQAGQQIRAHMAHFRTDRIGQHCGIVAAAKQGRAGVVDKAIGDTFVIPEGRAHAPCDLFALLHRRQDWLGHARMHPGHRPTLQLGQRSNARHLFHKIGLAKDIGAPTWDMGHVAFKLEAKAGQGLALLGFGDFHANKRAHARRIKPIGARHIWHLPGGDAV